MPYEDYANLTDADFENLPPLVPEGEDREKILAAVVERWATQTGDLFDESGKYTAGFYTLENHPATLRWIDLRDDNPDAEPIDLGRDLLQPLAHRLAGQATGEDSPAHPPTAVTLLGCRIHQTNATELDISSRLAVTDSRFDEAANFDSAMFNAGTDFRGATFNANTDFSGATFNADTDFSEATFNANTDFDEATFNALTNLGWTTFNEGTSFREAKFNEVTSFRKATFNEVTSFRKATFNKFTSFHNATFNSGTDFSGATFNEGADFSWATFNAAIFFSGATFNEDTYFSWAMFHAGADFSEATFNADTFFFRSDLRRARIESGPVPRRTFKMGRWLSLLIGDPIDWRRVRAIGELAALTRISYLALAGVPLLAGLWGPARGWIAHQSGALESTSEEFKNLIKGHAGDSPPAEALYGLADSLGRETLPETLPVGWLLAFLAAFAVVMGQLVYQLFAPELIRQGSEDELVENANERNRIDNGIQQERLKQSISHLSDAAIVMPHRHNRWFVQRPNGTVWIPDNVEEHFRDAEVEVPRPDDISEDDWEPTTEKALDQEVLPDERMRIAIEEGEKARYAVAAFEARPWAWLSGGLYVFAGWLLLVIVLRQLGHIAAASPADWLAVGPRILTQGWFVTVTSLGILALTAFGVLLVNRGGFTTWLEARLDKQEKLIERLARWCGNWKFYTAAIVALLVVLSVTYAINQ
ncbi:MAG: pentapeptide repeat-containing protein [Planctomycetota bacterium]